MFVCESVYPALTQLKLVKFVVKISKYLQCRIRMTRSSMADKEVVEIKSGWFWDWFHWSPTSITMLRAAEKKILSCLKTAYRGWYVDIGPVVSTSDKIWTISLNEESNNTPLLLLHGLGAGVALWCLNLDALAATRPVYAIDILGFGRSSRPQFSSDAMEAEKQLVTSVEEWRREMNLDKLIFLGHSLGGFLATSYAIRYPDRVKHLILADPWGFPEKPPDVVQQLPFFWRAILYVVQPFNPLWLVRFAGPYGQWVIEKTRPDIVRKFSAIVDNTEVIPQYIFQCNAQSPSGESAFHAMMATFGWAKHPMINRIDSLREDIPVTLIYGARSWINNTSWDKIRSKRSGSYFNIQVITGAGHHVYADKADIFNRHVTEACAKTDTGELERSLDQPEFSSSASLDVSSACENETSEPESDDILDAPPNVNKTGSTQDSTS